MNPSDVSEPRDEAPQQDMQGSVPPEELGAIVAPADTAASLLAAGGEAPREPSHDVEYYDEDDYEPFEDDGADPGAECGRWSNGRLMSSCSKAGSEECDFECPYSQ